MKIDFAKSRRELYTATAAIREVDVEKAAYLAVDGRGAPGGEAFQAAMPALYGTAYTVKFARKFAGRGDFAVGRLECVYLDKDPARLPRDRWRWRVLIRVPEGVTAADVAAARRSLKERKGLDGPRVRRVTMTEGAALQTLHVGPYDQLGRTYDRLLEAARGRKRSGPAHEIYLSDPRRVPPGRLKTIVRVPIARARRRR
jgi:hypothetical protein